MLDSFGFGLASAADGGRLYGFPAAVPCLLLEYAELGSIWQQLQPSPGVRQPMTANQAFKVVGAVLSAIIACHTAGYIHRDIKPQNVVIVAAGPAKIPVHKLCDFGIAVELPNGRTSHDNDDSVGTLQLNPPESKWMLESDTWGIGLLLFTCRTASLPPELPKGERGRMYEVLRADPAYSHLLPIEWDLLRVCLQPDAGHRPYACTLGKRTNYFRVKPEPDKP